ncbi:HNH endonuclease [Phyllobacterium brassicacearum]|uniref:HNH endonuclease n=1 Tax=Phyllobacterium brassicacearum TaxID=314235 RepID=A0A2P7BPT7_9HYPH|nr:HNH endonuclease [Phyllobacterium brassicacearum]PSH68491.1 HNH endonuclease [Phyllobacterium brassicacearum]TDQ19817.1 5-methylcytosine-specific restriction protein A [Phyllobacterium brassicacearum]
MSAGIYDRRGEVHARFGGQQRGGIITPARHALVIIITGEEGLEHGYADRLRADGTFEYFGEGQVGPMTMHKGNAAIANHSANGKSLLLFKTTKQGLRFEDEMVYESHHIEQAPDREGNLRDAIVFELRPIDGVTEVVEELAPRPSSSDTELEELRKRAFAAAKESPGKTKSASTIFERSRDVRDYVVARAKGHCEGCEAPAPFHRPYGVPYLEPHHIRRLTDGGPDDPRHVIGLCPNCHRRVHSGADGTTYNLDLAKRMLAIEIA